MFKTNTAVTKGTPDSVFLPGQEQGKRQPGTDRVNLGNKSIWNHKAYYYYYIYWHHPVLGLASIYLYISLSEPELSKSSFCQVLTEVVLEIVDKSQNNELAWRKI